jgi:hypothetical protein
MSEALWLRETDPLALLALRHPMRSHGSAMPQSRQSRFYLLACARRQWARLPTVARVVLGLAEAFAEAPRREKDLAAVAAVAEQLMHSAGDPDDLRSAELGLLLAAATARLGADLDRARREARDPPAAPPIPAFSADEWRGAAALLYLPFEPKTPTYAWVPPPLHDVGLLRDVYGNPYRHVPFSPAWRTDTVVAFARRIYESREFGAMPIFADALEDAGCDSAEVLSHCRSGGPHARGCWVLDRVLGKK